MRAECSTAQALAHGLAIPDSSVTLQPGSQFAVFAAPGSTHTVSGLGRSLCTCICFANENFTVCKHMLKAQDMLCSPSHSYILRACGEFHGTTQGTSMQLQLATDVAQAVKRLLQDQVIGEATGMGAWGCGGMGPVIFAVHPVTQLGISGVRVLWQRHLLNCFL